MPLCLERGGPALSHLFFADDLVLFSSIEASQVHLINRVLDDFCSSSGHKISSSKTTILFSNNVPLGTKAWVSEELGFGSTEDLSKYLGVPLLH